MQFTGEPMPNFFLVLDLFDQGLLLGYFLFYYFSLSKQYIMLAGNGGENDGLHISTQNYT